MGQIKFFLVALDEFSEFYKEYNINTSTHNQTINKNSTIKTINLWNDYINKNQYEINEFLINEKANKKDFLEKFACFIHNLKKDETGVFLINTHGRRNIVKNNTYDLDSENERMLLYDDWLIDDEIRNILNFKNEKANFIGIIDTCEATEDFEETPFEYQKVPDTISKFVKNEIFLFGSCTNKSNIQNSIGRFNKDGYSIFLFELLETLKKDNNISYINWFDVTKNKIVFDTQITQQKPIMLNNNLDLIYKKVFTNEEIIFTITTLPVVYGENCLAKIGIFDGIFFNKKQDFYKTIYFENIINTYQEIFEFEKNKNLLLINNQKIIELELELNKNKIKKI